MTDDLDQLLGRLSARAPHPGLDAVSASVLDRVAAPPAPRRDAFLLTSALAVVAAVGIGFAGGLTQPTHAQPLVFDAGWSLAPSTLLGG